MDIKVMGVIPARWGSSRFPGKALALLCGRPLVEHVYRQAAAASLLDRVVVATDDNRILQAVRDFGGEALLTSRDHASGTDRVAEVARQYSASVVVNIQGDEPLLPPADIDAAVEPLLANAGPEAVTLAAPMASAEDLASPHVVKVVVDASGHALYFSRSPIPFQRSAGGPVAAQARHHLGLYAYRRSFLLEFASWPPGLLEGVESLEQLRILERGRRLKVVDVQAATPGVDTAADLERVARLIGRRSP